VARVKYGCGDAALQGRFRDSDYVPQTPRFVHHGRVRIRVDVGGMSCRGITMLELLVVLVLVGIVAALALPSYRQQMIRVHRTEAMAALLQLQAAEEKFYLRHNAYTANMGAAPPTGLGVPTASASGKYLLTVAVADDGQSFIATATPTPAGGQDADHECLAFSIDARGRRAVSGTRDVRDCFR
jgi:type IV pilus assembly protein PilE